MIAWIAIKDQLVYRREIFAAGLRTLGYRIEFGLPQAGRPDDVLVIWNRQNASHEAAKRVESAGGKVLVAENGYLGKQWLDDTWFAISRNHHNGAGTWPIGGPERWDDLGVELAPWREGGREVVVLRQHGIGEPGVAMPRNWIAPGRVREHPGRKSVKPLELDLAEARAVITWGSGAALKALAMGIPVYHACPTWIGALAARRFEWPLPKPFLGDRLPMFRRLVWAMWRDGEVESGEAFRRLLLER